MSSINVRLARGTVFGAPKSVGLQEGFGPTSRELQKVVRDGCFVGRPSVRVFKRAPGAATGGFAIAQGRVVCGPPSPWSQRAVLDEEDPWVEFEACGPALGFRVRKTKRQKLSLALVMGDQEKARGAMTLRPRRSPMKKTIACDVDKLAAQRAEASPMRHAVSFI